MSEAQAVEGAQATTQAPAVAADTPPATDKPVGGLEGSGQVATPSPSSTEVAKPEPVKVVVPEKYDLKLSEGSLLKSDHLAQVEAFAKSHNLNAKQAQELLTREETSIRGFHEAAQAQAKQEIEAWKKDSMHDPEFGGEKLQASAEIAKRAMTKYGGEKLSSILDQTGYGNHPEVIRMFYRIGQAMSEGRMIPGGSATGSTVPIENKFYKQK